MLHANWGYEPVPSVGCLPEQLVLGDEGLGTVWLGAVKGLLTTLAVSLRGQQTQRGLVPTEPLPQLPFTLSFSPQLQASLLCQQGGAKGSGGSVL